MHEYDQQFYIATCDLVYWFQYRDEYQCNNEGMSFLINIFITILCVYSKQWLEELMVLICVAVSIHVPND